MPSQRAREIGERVERFVRDVVIPYESDPRRDHHGAPLDELVYEMRGLARAAGVLTPHVLPDGGHLTQLETAYVLQKSGLSPLGPLAVNTMAPDEGNMYLLGKVGSPEIKERFLKPLVEGRARAPTRRDRRPPTAPSPRSSRRSGARSPARSRSTGRSATPTPLRRPRSTESPSTE